MRWPDDVEQVLQHFPIQVGACRAVSSDGFSGARLWRVTEGDREYCLRRWPEGFRRRRLQSINQVLAQVSLPYVPRPIVANQLDTIVAHGAFLWSLQTWMLGNPVSKVPPQRELLGNASQALARFHEATKGFSNLYQADSEFELPGQTFHVCGDRIPAGLNARAAQTTALLQNRLSGLTTARIPAELQELDSRRESLYPLFLELAPRVLAESEDALKRIVPVRICLRDIHRDHILFTGDEITGLIDFDAMQVDSVATDLARLLGSYCGDDFELWEVGLDAYDEIRPLSTEERNLVVHYDRFAVLLTGLQWLDWILLEGKQFELAKVLPRIDATLERLEHLRARLRTGGGLIL